MTTRVNDVDELTAEIVDGLDLVAIPTIRPPARRRQSARARGDAAMVAVFVLVGLITATVATPYGRGALSDGVRLVERVLGGRSLGGSSPLLGTTLAGVRLGTTTDDVLRVLGTPSWRGAETQWIYDRGIIVVFGPTTSEVTGREETWRVQRVVAWSGSGARTEEGFFLDGCLSSPARDPSAPGCGREALRESGAFRETYSGFEVEEWTNGRSTRFEPFRILSVHGLTPDGNDVVLRASFGPLAERIELSLSRHERLQWSDAEIQHWQGLPPQRLRDLQPARSLYRPDPFAISACELLARAEVTAGYGEGWGIKTGHVDANEHVCTVRNGGPGDPQMYWLPLAVRPDELPRVLDKSAFSARGWRSTGSGRWSGYDPTGDPMLAVYVEPYFFVVSADSEDHVERLADAVRAELTGP